MVLTGLARMGVCTLVILMHIPESLKPGDCQNDGAVKLAMSRSHGSRDPVNSALYFAESLLKPYPEILIVQSFFEIRRF